jgi:hypothetical protein
MCIAVTSKRRRAGPFYDGPKQVTPAAIAGGKQLTLNRSTSLQSMARGSNSDQIRKIQTR